MSFFQKIKSFFTSSTSGAKSAHQASESAEGVISNFNRSRGFGFIHSKAYERKVFLHISDMEGRIRVGQKVSFEVENTDKGLRARNVEPI